MVREHDPPQALVVPPAFHQLHRRKTEPLLVDVGRVGREAAGRLAADLRDVAHVAGEPEQLALAEDRLHHHVLRQVAVAAIRVVVDDDVAGLEELRRRTPRASTAPCSGSPPSSTACSSSPRSGCRRASSSTVEKSRPSLKIVEYDVFIITSAISAAMFVSALCRTCRPTVSSSSVFFTSSSRSRGRARRCRRPGRVSPGWTSVVESGSSITSGPSSSAPGTSDERRTTAHVDGAGRVEPHRTLLGRPAATRGESANAGGCSGPSAVTRRLTSSTVSPGRAKPYCRSCSASNRRSSSSQLPSSRSPGGSATSSS